MKDLAGTSTRGTVVVGPEVDLKTLAALKELSSTVDIKVTGVGSPYVPTESIDDLCSLGALGSAHPYRSSKTSSIAPNATDPTAAKPSSSSSAQM